MRADFQVMKDISQFTRIVPTKRGEELLRFTQQLQQNKEVKTNEHAITLTIANNVYIYKSSLSLSYTDTRTRTHPHPHKATGLSHMRTSLILIKRLTALTFFVFRSLRSYRTGIWPFSRTCSRCRAVCCRRRWSSSATTLGSPSIPIRASGAILQR